MMGNNFYVYKFVNSLNEVIYVGITGCIHGRIKNQHFTRYGHLPISCYKETISVLYSLCLSSDDAKIKERYLINMLSPKYNQKMNNGASFKFDINDFQWLEIAFDKSGIDCVQGRKRKEEILKQFKRDKDLYERYKSFYQECVKEEIGRYFLLKMATDSWAIVWHENLRWEDYLEIICNGKFFTMFNGEVPLFRCKEDALNWFISNHEQEASRLSKHEERLEQDEVCLLNELMVARKMVMNKRVGNFSYTSLMRG